MADSVLKGVSEGIGSVVKQTAGTVVGEVGKVAVTAGQQIIDQQPTQEQGEIAALEAKKAQDAAQTRQKIAQIQASLKAAQTSQQQAKQQEKVKTQEKMAELQKKEEKKLPPPALAVKSTAEKKFGAG